MFTQSSLRLDQSDWKYLNVIAENPLKITIRKLLSLCPALKNVTEKELEGLVAERKVRVNEAPLAVRKEKPAIDVLLWTDDVVDINGVEIVCSSMNSIVNTTS